MLARTRLVLTRVGVRQYSSVPGHGKVYALPFRLKEDRAKEIINVASYVNQHAFLSLFTVLKSVTHRNMLLLTCLEYSITCLFSSQIFTKTLPDVKQQASSLKMRKAYIPMWLYDMAITASVTPSCNDAKAFEQMGPKREILGIGFDCFWPGMSWDPVCYLSFSKPTRPEDLVPFEPDLYNDDPSIQVIPFSVNPIRDLVDRVSTINTPLTLAWSSYRDATWTLTEPKVTLSAFYPLYMPVYVAQFWIESKKEERTVVIEADRDDPSLYQWDPQQSLAKQWINNGSWLNIDVTEPLFRGSGSIVKQTPMLQLIDMFATQVVGSHTDAPLDWDDLRIQSFPRHSSANKTYLQQLYKVWAERNMIARIENLKGTKKALAMGKDGIHIRSVERVKQDILDKVGDELKKLEQVEPAWLREFNKRHSSSY